MLTPQELMDHIGTITKYQHIKAGCVFNINYDVKLQDISLLDDRFILMTYNGTVQYDNSDVPFYQGDLYVKVDIKLVHNRGDDLEKALDINILNGVRVRALHKYMEHINILEDDSDDK